jgi:hypothetical protein
MTPTPIYSHRCTGLNRQSPLQDSSQQDQPQDSEHEAAAKRAESLGDHRAARWIRHCRPLYTPSNPRWRFTCGLRAHCPSCSERFARRSAARLALAGARMANPTLALFTSPAWNLWSLSQALDRLQVGLRTLRRRKLFSWVVGGAGSIEPKLANNGTQWNVHAHCLLDVPDQPPGEWLGEVNAVWRKLAGGTFTLEPVRNLQALSNYAFKTAPRDKDYAPAVGSLDLGRFRVLLWGLYRRRLYIAWGTGR